MRGAGEDSGVDIAFALCGMEDQEFRVFASYCDSYSQGQECVPSVSMETPLDYLLHHGSVKTATGGAEGTGGAEAMSPLSPRKSLPLSPRKSLPTSSSKLSPTSPTKSAPASKASHPGTGNAESQTVVHKLFAQVYDRKVWKRRLLLITESMLLVMKRPDDHYLKNVVAFKDTYPACAVVNDDHVACGWRGQA